MKKLFLLLAVVGMMFTACEAGGDFDDNGNGNQTEQPGENGGENGDNSGENGGNSGDNSGDNSGEGGGNSGDNGGDNGGNSGDNSGDNSGEGGGNSGDNGGDNGGNSGDNSGDNSGEGGGNSGDNGGNSGVDIAASDIVGNWAGISDEGGYIEGNEKYEWNDTYKPGENGSFGYIFNADGKGVWYGYYSANNPYSTSTPRISLRSSRSRRAKALANRSLLSDEIVREESEIEWALSGRKLTITSYETHPDGTTDTFSDEFEVESVTATQLVLSYNHEGYLDDGEYYKDWGKITYQRITK